jgi:hypothetical protein
MGNSSPRPLPWSVGRPLPLSPYVFFLPDHIDESLDFLGRFVDLPKGCLRIEVALVEVVR